MEVIMLSIICFFLVFLSYQDFRYRAISWWIIPLLFVFLAYNNIKNFSFDIVKNNFLLNFGFVLIQLGILYIYFSIKNRRFVNIINTYIGIGDILFFAVLTVCFSFFNYLVFQIVSFFLVAIGFGLFRLFKKDFTPEIPLAGGMSLLLFLSFIVGKIYSISFYKDLVLLTY